MRLRDRRWVFVLVAFAFACGTPPDELAPTRTALSSIIATCSARSGDVQLKRKGEGFWSEAQIASVFRAGDWLKTGPFSSARVELLSGGALELDEKASVVLEANPTGDGDAPLVTVEEGDVKGTLSPEGGGLQLKLADGSEARLTAKGGAPLEFRLSKGRGGTDVRLSKGEATLQTKGEKRELSQGSVASVSRAGVRQIELPSPPNLLSPAPEALVRRSGEVGVSWARVEAASSYRLQYAKDAQFTRETISLDVPDTSARVAVSSAGAVYWRVASLDEEGRVGAFSKTTRFFATERPVDDSLLKPADRAVYAFVDAPPRLSFSWKDAGEEAYLLVIGAGPDLLNQRLSTQEVKQPVANIDGITQGQYYWGVYRASGEPVFTHPRRLTVVKNAAAVLKTPKRINKWGK